MALHVAQTLPRPPRWIAERDGIAHAVRPGTTRAACGAPKPDERWAHPPVKRCRPCVGIVEGIDS